jgi:hypothetical protein
MEVKRGNSIFSLLGLAWPPTTHDTAFRAVDQSVVLIIEIELWKQPGRVNEGCWCHSWWLRL